MISSGPLDAKIMIVGEAPGSTEERYKRPFVGDGGSELTKILTEAGINREDCYLTYVTPFRPPGNDIEQFFYGKKEAKLLGASPVLGRFPKQQITDGMRQLYATMHAVKPNVILALGDTALWALGGKEGITKWRGSIMPGDLYKVIPSFNPDAVLRQWNQRAILVQDCRRAAREAAYPEIRKPNWNFIVRPTFKQAREYLLKLLRAKPGLLACDLETRNWQIACVGLATSKTDAICIPFMCTEGDGNYWSIEDELQIVDLLRAVLQRHHVIFHNGIYDCQYFGRQWGYLPNIKHDTMVMQHVCFPGMMGGKIDATTGTVSKMGSSLALSFLSSMYCAYHYYWKDDGRLFDPTVQSEDVLWKYNAEDCVRTFECCEVLSGALQSYLLTEQYEFEMSLFEPVLDMMFRGVRIDTAYRNKLDQELGEAAKLTLEWLETAAGHSFNPDSSRQMATLFYSDLKVKKVISRKTGQPTLDAKALDIIRKREPLLKPFIDKIEEYRSLRVFRSTFIQAPIDPDDRMRCAFNIAGVETFRFSSNQNAFGTGTNLQNLPKGTEK